ncbi:MAG: hypothetical protein ACLUNV_04075 [Sutterella wadsworthensis]
MAANVETTVKGLAAAYECTYKLTRMGEAVTYKGDEEAVELVKAAARDAEGVTLVTDMNAKVVWWRRLYHAHPPHPGTRRQVRLLLLRVRPPRSSPAPTSRSRTAPRSPSAGASSRDSSARDQRTMTPITPE